MILGPEAVKITHVNDSGDHIVGIIPARKLVVGMYVSNTQDVRGRFIHISKAKITKHQECPPKFYNTYRINDISPYESNWSYAEIDIDSVVFAEPPPFTPIPVSTATKRKTLMESIEIGSVWSNGKDTWVIRDICEETLMGKTRTRVWVSTPQGKRGQAIYADSLVNSYKLDNAQH